MTAPMSSTAKWNKSKLVIHIYPGSDAHCIVYDDDGTSDSFLEGELQTITMNYRKDKNELVIDAICGSYESAPAEREINFIVHDATGLRETSAAWNVENSLVLPV